MLEAINIHKTYDNGKKKLEVLRGVNFDIQRGGFIAIVGPSGAGKSTLLHILGGLDSPTQGNVFLENQDLYRLEDTALSKIRNSRVGFVFQFYHLLPEFTALENVMLPAMIGGQKKEELAKRLLEKVGLGQRLAHFPNQLSGGEKQRVAIARGLINQPQVLFCDEPTGNLDSKAGEEITALIKKISLESGMAVVMVTHNFEIARIADKVYHLKDGVLVN